MLSRDVDKVLAKFALRYPAVEVTQLQVVHPGADDDGLWFFRLNGIEMQIESSTGNCPFLIESDANHERIEAKMFRRSWESSPLDLD